MTTKPQDALKAKLGSLGIPFKQIDCYGSQIVVTTYGEQSAKRFASVIDTFAQVRGTLKTTERNLVNNNTCLCPSRHTVWRVYGVVK